MNIAIELHRLCCAGIALAVGFALASQASADAGAPAKVGSRSIPTNGYSWESIGVPRDFSQECSVRFGNVELKSNEISVYLLSDKTPCSPSRYSFYVEQTWVGAGTYTVNVYKDNVFARTETKTFVDVAPERTPVYSLINARTNTYLITADKAERNTLDPAVWKIADTGFTVWSNANNFVAGGFYAPLAPVYRFYIPSKSTHFYTISTVDRDFLRSLPNVFVDLGIAFWAMPLGPSSFGSSTIPALVAARLCPSVLRPVYRLYNTKRGVHRYTVSPDIVNVMERGLYYDDLDGNVSPLNPGEAEDRAWQFEGTAFCVPAS
jgi:hypothetical protein